MGLPESFVLPVLGDTVAQHPELLGLPRGELVLIITSRSAPLCLRLAAANRLALEGDPRIDPFDPMMVTVAGATFEMGLDEDQVDVVAERWATVGLDPQWILKEVPRHQRTVAGFRIGRCAVTNLEFRTYLDSNLDGITPSSWHLGAYPAWWSNHPVHGVTLQMARDYARWLSWATGRRFRLPTESEWELAATGGSPHEFPWGPEWDARRANTVEGGPLTTTPVGVYLEGASRCGALDMAGNVEEWVDSLYAPYPGGRPLQDDLWRATNGAYHVARGGSYSRFGDLARSRRRHGPFPGGLDAVGFRLVEDV